MKANTNNGLGFFSVLFLIFLTLKLVGVIQWSWIWVFSPLWGPLLLFIIIITIVALINVLLDD